MHNGTHAAAMLEQPSGFDEATRGVEEKHDALRRTMLYSESTQYASCACVLYVIDSTPTRRMKKSSRPIQRCIDVKQETIQATRTAASIAAWLRCASYNRTIASIAMWLQCEQRNMLSSIAVRLRYVSCKGCFDRRLATMCIVQQTDCIDRHVAAM